MMTDATGLAQRLLDAHQPARALEVLAAVLASSPDDVEALRLASLACVTVGRTADGIRFAESALRIDPQNPSVMRALAWAASQARSDAPRALRIARELVRRHPDDPGTLAFFADIAASAGDRTRASLRIGQRAVAIAPNDPSTHHALARLWLGREETRRARREFEATLRLDPQHEPARYNLAVIRSGGLDVLAGARDLVELGRTSTDREREAAAVAGVLSGFVYVSALVSIFAASLVPVFLTDPTAHPVVRWVLAAFSVLGPLAAGAWFRLRLGRRSLALLGDLARRRPLVIAAAVIVPLSALAWIAAAASPAQSQDWYRWAMAPGLVAALLCLGAGLAPGYRRR